MGSVCATDDFLQCLMAINSFKRRHYDDFVTITRSEAGAHCLHSTDSSFLHMSDIFYQKPNLSFQIVTYHFIHFYR